MDKHVSNRKTTLSIVVVLVYVEKSNAIRCFDLTSRQKINLNHGDD